MKPNETIDYPIRMVWSKIAKQYNSAAAKHDSSLTIGYILLNIEESGTPSTSLGPMLGLEPRSMVRTLAMMEDKKLITRVKDQLDKRKVRIHLTELGKEKRNISRMAVIELNTFIQEKLNKEKLATFFEILWEINNMLEKEKIFE